MSTKTIKIAHKQQHSDVYMMRHQTVRVWEVVKLSECFCNICFSILCTHWWSLRICFVSHKEIPLVSIIKQCETKHIHELHPGRGGAPSCKSDNRQVIIQQGLFSLLWSRNGSKTYFKVCHRLEKFDQENHKDLCLIQLPLSQIRHLCFPC